MPSPSKNATNREDSSIKTRITAAASVLVMLGIGTLLMKYMLGTDIGFSRIFGVLVAAYLGYFGHKLIYDESVVPAKQEQEKSEDTQPQPTKPQEQQTQVPQPKPIMHTPGPVFKQPPNKQMSRKKFSPNLKGNFIFPREVIYSNGIPKDVGFGRGDQQQQMGGVWLSAKIYIPEVKGYSFIGRILGPRGISVRRLEAETECKILIRGRGSVKDEKREQALINRNGWAHLRDDLHVLLLANDESEKQCRKRLDTAVDIIQRLLIPQYDEYKRQQLVHLAILNGTYRP